jgi:pimeloyl-ACP methyl ester carboxylesterase
MSHSSSWPRGRRFRELETTLYRDGVQYRKQGVSAEDIARISALKVVVDCYYGTLTGFDEAKRTLDSVRGQAWVARGNWPELTSRYELYPPSFVLAHRDTFHFFVEAMYEPRPALERMSVPVLALYGLADESVPVDTSVRVLRDIFSRKAKPDLTIRTYQGASHGIMVGGAFAPGYLSDMRDWLAARFAP